MNEMNETTKSLSDTCYEIYQTSGYTGVFDYVEKNRPDLHWKACEPCELNTPSDKDDSCLVCGSKYPEGSEPINIT